jgi:hypothetical protein
VAMSEAISSFCQVFGLDDVPSGSSPRVACRPWAAMCAADSARRCITARGGNEPSRARLSSARLSHELEKAARLGSLLAREPARRANEPRYKIKSALYIII